MYSRFGLIDRPLNPTGVPRIERRYSPVGFERELARLRDVLSTFMKGSDNIAVVVVGQYGFGKSELLDAFETEVARAGLRVIRIPLTFGLDVASTINTILKSRGDPSQPLVVLVDEADEVSRVVSLGELLKEGDAGRVRDLVIRLGSFIRALMEPRNYAQVLGINPTALGRVMLVLAFTPQLYYNILKNSAPDIFDISRGRVYTEVPIDERMPLWLFHALLIQRFNAYSTEERLRLVSNGVLNPIYPLRIEYLATLYEVVSFMEGGSPSPRGLVKFTSKLLDFIVERGGELNYETFEEFLRWEVSNNELSLNIDLLNEGPNDEGTLKVLKALVLSGIPRTPEDLRAELGFDVNNALSALVKSGLAEEVYVVKLQVSDEVIDRVNELFIKLGYPPLDHDVRSLSMNYGTYYTLFENEPRLYIILPSNDEFRSLFRGFRAYQASVKLHRLFIYGKEPEEYIRAREEVLRANEVFNEFSERLAVDLVNALVGSLGSLHRLMPNTWVGVLENPLDIRFGIVVSLNEELNSLTKALGKIISEGSVTINNQERFIDSLILIILLKTSLTSEVQGKIRELLQNTQWKGVLGPATGYVYPVIFGSDSLNNAREVLIGYRVEKLGRVPREFNPLIEKLNALREEVSAFKDRSRQEALKLTMAIRRGAKESKDSVIRRIVTAWVQGGELNDQPDVFRDSQGRARVTPVEELFVKYLRSLGRKRFTIKELEYLVRRLFPTHLWREFRESDLIRLMLLRGLLGPLSRDYDEVTIITPETSGEVVKVLGDVYGELRKRANTDAQVIVKPLGISLRVKVHVNVNVDCEKQYNMLKAIPPTSQDFMRRYSMFVLCLDELREAVDSAREQYLGELSSITAKLNGDVESLINKLMGARKALDSGPTEVSSIISQRIDSVINNLRSYLERLDGLDLESFRESIPSIMNSVEQEINEVLNLVNLVGQVIKEVNDYVEVANVLRNASKILGVNTPVVDREHLIRDLITIVRTNDLNLLRNYLDDLTQALGKVRINLSDYLARVEGQLGMYNRVVAWLRKRSATNEILTKLRVGERVHEIKASPNLDNTEEIIGGIKSIGEVINELSSKVNVPSNVIMAVASLGPNVGIDEDELAKYLGVDRATVGKYLETLWRHGLIDRRYVT
ncbi:hypothetical protein [Vulcanisaeta thermophila]|uniref:hypothetical protein n=1 Tax=Vulcanisaeta thermophila TaxID=867917 RepID=UPI000853DC2D|nr:hypothetical protein [Vulcanisaeta thermophila]